MTQRPGLQRLDNRIQTSLLSVCQRSTLLRPAQPERSATIRIVSRGDNLLGGAVAALMQHLPDRTGGECRRAGGMCRVPAEQGVDPALERPSVGVPLGALRT